jgi:DNA mismatch repair ATPase MutL
MHSSIGPGFEEEGEEEPDSQHSEISSKWRCEDERPHSASRGLGEEEDARSPAGCGTCAHVASLPAAAAASSSPSVKTLYDAFKLGTALEGSPADPLLGLDPASALRPGFRGINAVRPHRFTKDMFERLVVVGQVDRKFIACTLAEPRPGQPLAEPLPAMVVIVDQHAADERVNVERLERELFQRPSTPPGTALDEDLFMPSQCTAVRKQLAAHPLPRPLRIRISEAYRSLLDRYCAEITAWGLAHTCVVVEGRCYVDVEQLPAIFFKDMAPTAGAWVSDGFVREFLDELMDSVQHAGAAGLAVVPRCIMRAVNMKACHDAIKFGDQLSLEECVALIARLSRCRFPFQCAHGRPSMIPLFDLRDT